MIVGYARHEGMGHKTLDIYGDVCNEGTVVPNIVAFECWLELQAVASVGVVRTSELVGLAYDSGGLWQSDQHVGNLGPLSKNITRVMLGRKGIPTHQQNGYVICKACPNFIKKEKKCYPYPKFTLVSVFA